MKLFRYIPAVLTVFLIIGILLGYYFNPSFYLVLGVLVIVFLLLVMSHFVLNSTFKKKYFFTVLTFVLFILIGIFTQITHDKILNKQFYTHFIEDNANIKIIISDKLKSNLYYEKYLANISQINDKAVLGTVLLNVQKDSTKYNSIQIGDVFYVKSHFNPINIRLNPFQFDYKSYLKKQQIYHQLTVTKADLFFLEKKASILNSIISFRTTIIQKLKKYSFKKDELAILNTLILGQRKEVSKALLQKYTNAGAIHILAVSGLHIGILLLLLNFLLKPVERIKNGKIIKAILIVILLWLYAIIAGLSPSVIRAVTMFTAITIGIFFNKKTSTVHSLFISMFLLLLFHPLYLFSVGFQLSYLAVFSIVYVYPLFNRFYYSKFWLLRKVWQLFAISFAAQIGTLPLSLYYFHQFPALFFISNLVIVPFLGVILSMGLLIILLALFAILPDFLVHFYGWIIHAMNTFITFIANQEHFIIKEITWSIYLVFVTYLIFIGFYQFIKKPSKRKLQIVLGAIIFFQGMIIYEKYLLQATNQFIIFNSSKNSIITHRKGNMATLFLSDTTKLKAHTIYNNYVVGTGKLSTQILPLRNIYKFNKTTILLVDSLNVYQVPNLKTTTILLCQSPKINLNRLIAIYKPKMIIADASNYKSYKKRWKKTCDDSKVFFYDTSVKGAYIIEEYQNDFEMRLINSFFSPFFSSKN